MKPKTKPSAKAPGRPYPPRFVRERSRVNPANQYVPPTKSFSSRRPSRRGY